MLVDYGAYIIQRHHPVETEAILPSAAETENLLMRSAKKESLRKSLEKYEEFQSSVKKEFPRSPAIPRGTTVKTPEKSAEKMVPAKPQINEIKDELAKLSHDFQGCKRVVNESISEVKTILEKLKGKVPEIGKKPTEQEELPKGSDDSFVKIKPGRGEESESQNVVVAPEDVAEPKAVISEKISTIEATVKVPHEEAKSELSQPQEEPHVEPTLIKPPEAVPEKPEEDKAKSAATEPAAAQNPSPVPEVDPGLLKTDEFILEKFKKIGHTKELLKSLHL